MDSSKNKPFLRSGWEERGSAFRNLNEALDKEKDLLTRRMGAKLQTLLHMAATFNRYTI
jgi:hypothetical protein